MTGKTEIRKIIVTVAYLGGLYALMGVVGAVAARHPALYGF